MLKIKILGGGCANCKKLEELTREVVRTMEVEAEFEKVTDPQQIQQYPILSTPALVINETVASSGRIPAKTEIARWIGAAL